MNLIQRRAALLRTERRALLADFDSWFNITQNSGEWQKHFTQVRRIKLLLNGLLVGGDGAVAADEEAALRQLEAQARELRFAQRAWFYFRTKLELRSGGKDRQNLLRCADEFAWACYRPAWEAARQAQTIDVNDLKEPPLTFFTSDERPYVQVRAGRYKPEAVSAEDARSYGDQLVLPIPIIAMPWSHLSQAALTVTLAHEAGHAVDTDFGVGAAVDAAIVGLGAGLDGRGKAWLRWRRELFADAYAVLCVGPAHVIALSDYLLTTAEEVKRERVDLAKLEDYPPRQLRILFNVKLLAAIGLADVGVGQAWDDLYPVRGMPDFDAYAADAADVAHALLHTPIPKFGGKSVEEVICMTAQEWAEVERRAAQLPAVDGRLAWYATKHREAAEAQSLFRLTFAALALASYQADDPAAKATKLAGALPAMIGWIPYGTRGPAEDKAASEALYAEQQAHLAAAVAKLRQSAADAAQPEDPVTERI